MLLPTLAQTAGIAWQERVIVRFWGDSQLVGWPYFRFMRWRLRSFIFQAHLFLLLFGQGRSGRNDFAREAFGLYSDLAIPAVCDKGGKALAQLLWSFEATEFVGDVLRPRFALMFTVIQFASRAAGRCGAVALLYSNLSTLVLFFIESLLRLKVRVSLAD